MPMYIGVYQDVFKRLLGVDVPTQSLKDKFGFEPTGILLNILAEAGLTPEEIEFDKLISEIHKGIYSSIISLQPHPGVVDLLEKLDGSYVLAVATLRKQTSYDILDATDLTKYFELIVTGDDVEKPKPDPEIFLKTAKGIGIDPQDIWVIEDSPPGIRAAKSAGMKVIGVCTGGHPKDILTLEEPDVLVDTLKGFDSSILN